MTTQLSLAELSLPQQQQYQGAFPLALGLNTEAADKNQAIELIRNNRESLLQRLSQHGAILFRGFKVDSDLEFDNFLQAFQLDNFTYADSLSNAVRHNRTERVFTANEAPSSVSIFLHHEMAQTPIYPSKLFFYCEQAADSGGATPLCRSDILLQELEKVAPAFIEECVRKKVRYSNVMPANDDPKSGQGRSWASTLSTKNKAAAETKLASLGYTWQWLDDDALRVTSPVLDAIRELEDGRKVFFNQLIAAFRGWKDVRNATEKSILFGDDSDIDAGAMQLAIDLGDKLSFNVPWQNGDVVLVDNFLVMHGRRPFEGERRVLASLVA